MATDLIEPSKGVRMMERADGLGSTASSDDRAIPERLMKLLRPLRTTDREVQWPQIAQNKCLEA